MLVGEEEEEEEEEAAPKPTIFGNFIIHHVKVEQYPLGKRYQSEV